MAASPTYILKTLWPQKRVENLVYPEHPFFAMLPKHKDFFGENMYLAVRGADSQGRSAKFTTAQDNAAAHSGVRFLLTRASDYQVCRLSTESILAAKNDKGALVKNLDTEIESGLNNLTKALAVNLFKGQSGVIGAVTADPGTGTTFTLDNINDVTAFEVGMRIKFYAAVDGTARDATADQVTAVNRDTGVITVGGALDAAILSTGSKDFIIPEGDAYKDNNDVYAKVTGLDDWIPSSAPSATTFFGVNRSVDTVRYGGLRFDGSALNPEEALIGGLSRLAREGGSPDRMIVNHLDLRNIQMALGSKAVYEPIDVGGIGFSSVVVAGPKGKVALVADQDCTSGAGFALEMKTWGLYSLEDCPMIQDLDGTKLDRVYNADQWEARLCYFAQLGCTAPGHNARITLPT